MPTQQTLTATRGGLWVTLAGVGAVLALTLFPTGGAGSGTSPFCLVCGDLGAADAVLNVLLFVPLGVGLRLLGLRLGTAVLLGAGLSLSVELSQIALIPGRDASLGDLLFNTSGTGIGAWLTASIRVLFWPSHRLAARLSLAAAVVMSNVLMATGFLLQTSLPGSTYYGQWTPRLGHLEWYRGRVISARIGEVALPSGPIANSPRVRGLLSVGAVLQVEAIAGPPVPGLASLFSIFDESQRGILLVGPDRGDLVLRIRTRAEGLRLRRPDMRARGMMSGVKPGEALSVRVWRDEGQHCVSLNGRAHCTSFELSDGWKLLHSQDSLPRWFASGLSLLWLGALAVPVGFWYRRSALSNVAVGVAIISIVLVPRAFGLGGASFAELLAMTGGFLAGLGAQRVTAWKRLHPPEPSRTC